MFKDFVNLHYMLECRCGGKMNIINNLIDFLKTLTLVDIVFFVAIILLLILIVTLIYFIKINKSEVFDDTPKTGGNGENKNKSEIENIITEISNNIKTEREEYNDEEGELLDLNSLTEKLKQEEKDRIDVTLYERDQEEKAIISYDELIQKHHNYAINYEEEKVLDDDVVVKKIDLNNLVKESTEVKNGIEARVISYKREEDFLQALKELNRLLN